MVRLAGASRSAIAGGDLHMIEAWEFGSGVRRVMTSVRYGEGFPIIPCTIERLPHPSVALPSHGFTPIPAWISHDIHPTRARIKSEGVGGCVQCPRTALIAKSIFVRRESALPIGWLDTTLQLALLS